MTNFLDGSSDLYCRSPTTTRTALHSAAPHSPSSASNGNGNGQCNGSCQIEELWRSDAGAAAATMALNDRSNYIPPPNGKDGSVTASTVPATTDHVRVGVGFSVGAMGACTSEKRNTYDATVRAGHPRKASWRSGSRSSSNSSTGTSGHIPQEHEHPYQHSSPGELTYARHSQPAPALPALPHGLGQRPQSQHGPQPFWEPLPLADMLRNVLHRH